MSTSTTTATSSPLPTEMSDRFGPMLVKELRQGLRTKVFLTAFIGFQTILLIMVLAGFAASGNSSDSSTFLSAAIWALLTMMLIVITPLRGQFALDKEIRSGTLELLQITNLDAWRIVRGKWAALMGEALLYTTAALPYFTLRYFLGGVQILSDLGFLVLIVLFSGSLTAIVVGLSGFRSILLRLAVTIGIVMFVPLTINVIEAMSSPYRGSSPFGGIPFSQSWPVLAGWLLTMLIVAWCFLRLGARTIATQAENHTTGVRILTLAGMGVILLLDHFIVKSTGMLVDISAYFFCFFAFAIYTCGLFCAITDNSLQSSRIYIPFIRRRLTPVGRMLLYPGWGSGFLYVGLMSVALMLVSIMEKEAPEVVLAALMVFNFFMLPAAITRLMMRSRGNRLFQLSTYITMLVSCAVASSVLLAAEMWITNGDPVLTMVFPIPAVTGADMHSEALAVAMQAIAAFLVTGLMLIVAIEDLGFTRRRERASREMLAKQKLATEPARAKIES